MRDGFLPFAAPDIDQAELNEIKEALDSGWITTGPKAERFEQEFARFVGSKYAIAVNSCTAALHLALQATGLQAGDFVLTTPYTFAATAEVIRHLNGTPLLVDVDPDTLNMDPRALAETIDDLEGCLAAGGKPKTAGVDRIIGNGSSSGRKESLAANRDKRRSIAKAVIPVHLAGQPCEMDAINAVAADYQLAVIEDAAHALPAAYKSQRIGGVGRGGKRQAVCFSFYATKTLTTGEGGMLTTDNPEWAHSFRMMSLHGISQDAWKRYSSEEHWYYDIIAPGYKYNMSDIAAAMGLAQLKKAERMWERRKEIAQRYSEAFAHDSAFQLPTVRPDVEHAWHLYMLRLNSEHLSIDRAQFISALKRRNIGVSVHFIPLHLHSYYRDLYGYQPEDFPVAYREYQREISLPIYSKMSNRDVQDVIDAVTEVANSNRKRETIDAVIGF